MQKQYVIRLIALLLTLAISISCFPVLVFAADHVESEASIESAAASQSAGIAEPIPVLDVNAVPEIVGYRKLYPEIM